MRCPAVRKCSCIYIMYRININVFSCVLKVVRLQSDIYNTVGKLFHTEGPETAMFCVVERRLNTRNFTSALLVATPRKRSRNVLYSWTRRLIQSSNCLVFHSNSVIR